jgi:RHS repeat-associated protein
MFRSWWRGLIRRWTPSPRVRGRSAWRRRLPLTLELLETRTLLSAAPLTLADPSLYGVSGLGASSHPSISADGQLVAFTSTADNLVPNDTDHLPDAFVHNRSTGTTTLVSVGTNGSAAGVDAAPVISPDGRYVVFENGASYLDGTVVNGVTNDQLFLRDLTTGTTTLLTANVTGPGGGNRGSTDPIFSADSHHVAFISGADNLVTGYTYNHNHYLEDDVFERDLTTGVTKLVTVSLDGTSGVNGAYGGYALSADGRYVAFESSATNLTALSTQNIEQVYLRDTVAGVTQMVSVNFTGQAGAGGHNHLASDSQVISADGRYVMFYSNATDIVSPPQGAGRAAYLRDLRTGTTIALSVDSAGAIVNANGSGIINPDGRWAVFATSSTGVVSIPTNGKLNVYVRNLQTGAVSLASVNAAGTAGGNDNSGVGPFFDFAGGLEFSPDAHYLAFRSLATDLTSGVVTSNRNLYLRDLIAGTTQLVTPSTTGADGGTGDTVSSANSGLDLPAFSGDSRVVAFDDLSANLVANDNNQQEDVFVCDLGAQATLLASGRSPLLPAAYPATFGGHLGTASAHGRYVVITSASSAGTHPDLAPGVTFTATGGPEGIYRLDRQTGAIDVVDLNPAGQEVGGYGTGTAGGVAPAISADGRYVAFLSRAEDLVSGVSYANPQDRNIFVRDLVNHTTVIASVTPTGNDIDASSFADFVLSSDGRYVAFLSGSPQQLAGVTDPGGYRAVLLHDLQANTTSLVSHDLANDGQVRNDSLTPAISADGRYVLFRSLDTSLTTNDTNNGYDVFRWDRTTNSVALVSVNMAGTGPGNQPSSANERPVMTPDGRYIAFSSSAGDLAPSSSGSHSDIFVRDMGATPPTTTVIDVVPTGNASGNNSSSSPSISDDGSMVAFLSYATNLTANPAVGSGPRMFVRDRTTGTTTAVSVNLNGQAVYGGGFISPNGRYVFFGSDRTDLVPNFVDGNGSSGQDLYVRDLQQSFTKLVTTNQSGTASGNANTNSSSFDYRISGDSSTVFFDGDVSDLFAGDRNYQTDVFAAPTAGYSSISGQVFNDGNGNGTQDAGEGGLPYWTVYLDANGNGRLDPGEAYVLTDANGNFNLTDLTPGTCTVRIVPQPGNVQTTPATAYTVTIAADGTQVTGKNFGEQMQLPDLANATVAFSPMNAGPGQSTTVTWHVTNQGNGPASGNWVDAVYLSPTPTLGAGAELLGVAVHSGGLAVNASYTGTATLPLPPALGTWYVVVQADYRNQINEGAYNANKANNVAASASTLTLSIPTLTSNTPVQGTFSGLGSGFYYQISVPAGQTLTVALASAAASGVDEVYVRRGAYPDPSAFDFAARTPGQPNQTAVMPTTAGGTYYVYVRTLSGAASSASFTLTASLPVFGITSIDVASGGNIGRVTVPIHGTLLTTNTQAKLVKGATTISATAVLFQDASTLYATFDLTGVATGYYDVQLTDGNQTATLASGFAVVAGQAGTVQVSLSVPSAIRAGSTDGVVVRYVNTGTVDAVAPLITLTADHALFHLNDEPNLVLGAIQFLGISADGPAGVLRPGESGQLSIPLRSTATPGQDIHFSTQIADDTQPMKWASLKSSLRPNNVPADAWDAIYGNFTSNVGTTVGTYHAALAADASYLSKLGETTPDVARLLSFEINKAAGVFTSQTLTTIVDASFPAPGSPLTFTRQFQQSLIGRYTVGHFGRGWTDDWQYALTVDAQGNVSIQANGVSRFFAKQTNGSFVGANGDPASLSLINGTYQLREPEGPITAFNADGTLNYVQDANANRITAGYTGGQLTTLTHSDGAAITLAYTTINGNTLIQSVTDPGGRVTTYGYEATGQYLTSVMGRHGTTTYTYQSGQANPALNNALTQIAYSDHTHLYFGYDTQGRLTDQHRDGNQVDVAYTYPAGGGLTVTDATGSSATYRSDDFGQLRLATNPLGQVTRYAYDANHELIQVSGPLGISVSCTYDKQGNLTSTLDPLGNRVSFTYDGAHHLTSYQDAKGNTTTYQPDAAGNLLSITYPTVNGTTASQLFQYDPLGNMTETIDARGQALLFTYYTNGLVKQEAFADNTTQQYQYDTHGNLSQLIDRQGGTTTLQYDSADNLREIDYPGGRFLKFQYNGIGQRTQSLDQTGFTINYSYDVLGRLSALQDGGTNLIVSYLYDAVGRLAEKDLGNGTYTTYQYDPAGNLLQLVNHGPRPGVGQNGPINSEYDYIYDALNRMATATTPDGQWVYTYDADNQLTHAVFVPNGSSSLTAQDLQYHYDAAGNRTQTILNGVTTPYTVDARNEYTQIGSTAYAYDADGNLATTTTAGVTTTYSFDQLSELTGISTPAHGATPADVWGYGYDAFGHRTGTTHNSQLTTAEFDPMGLGNIAATFDNTGALTAHYTYGLGLVSQVPVAGTAGYYDFDLTGDTTGITSSAGTYANRYAYLPFGTVVASSGSLANPFTFVGQSGVTSDGSGLLNMRARAFDPASGQFGSSDPLGLNGGDTNIRRYVGNDPVSLIDPVGGQALSPGYGNFGLGYALITGAHGAGGPITGYCSNPFPGRDGWVRTDDHRNGIFSTRGIFRIFDANEGIPGFSLGNGPDTDYARRNGIFSTSGLFGIIYSNRGAPGFNLGDCCGGGPPGGPGGSGGFGGDGGFSGGDSGDGGGDGPSGGPGGSGPGGGGSQGGGPGGKSGSPGAFDPNELITPAGFGAAGFIDPAQVLPYTIGFENDPMKATAAAQDVTVTQTLDPNLDGSTFQLGDIQIGTITISVPAGLSSFTKTIDATNVDGTPLQVQISANLDEGTWVVTWTFLSLDPATGLAPADAVAGFLPVDDATGRGQAFVHYTIQPKANLATGTTISAQAIVVFDSNSPLNTNTAANTLDAGPPTSSVSPLPAVVNSTSFAVSWSGADDKGGSGIATYDVYVSVDGGAFTPWLTATAQTTATNTGSFDHTYAFFSVATDNLGHREATPAAAEASTTLAPPMPAPAPTPTAERGITAQLVTMRLHKRKHLVVRIIFADTGELKSELSSPFQTPGFKNIQVSVRDGNGDGVLDEVVVTARKGKRTVTATFVG